MPYSLESTSSDCYAGTTVLKNKLNIQNEKELNDIEAVVTAYRSAEYLCNSTNSSFDYFHYCEIHKYLFEDIYEWAGEIRKIDISKKGTIFHRAENLERDMKALFLYLKDENYFLNLNHNEFCDKIAEFFHDLNILHPFREGNGRTERLFITKLIQNAGYEIDFSEIDEDLLMIATIHAANGVLDYLKEIFNLHIV